MLFFGFKYNQKGYLEGFIIWFSTLFYLLNGIINSDLNMFDIIRHFIPGIDISEYGYLPISCANIAIFVDIIQILYLFVDHVLMLLLL